MGSRWTLKSRVAVVGALSLLAVLPTLAVAACGGSSTAASSSPSPTSGIPSLSEVMTSADASTAAPLPIPTVKLGEEPPAFADLLKMFAYDKSEPLGFERAGSVITPAGNAGQGIQFQSGGATARGYLVMPRGEGPFPVVVYAHGHGMGADLWLDEAQRWRRS